MWIRRDPEDPRRRRLVRLLAAGAFAIGPARGWAQTLLGNVPGPLPEGRSFYTIQGAVTVNGAQAGATTPVGPGDTVETGPGARTIFAVGSDAYLLRAGSSMQIEPESAVIGGLRLITGKLLSVFGRRELRVTTPQATIGIRGTGLYLETDPEQSYVCTCYGTTDIGASGDPASTETVDSEHHDDPRYVLAAGADGQRIRPAPFINHDDEELELLEALVGREVPFGFRFDPYGVRRRGYTP